MSLDRPGHVAAAVVGERRADRRHTPVVGAGDDDPDWFRADPAVDERLPGLLLEVAVKLAEPPQLGLGFAEMLPQILPHILFRPALAGDQLRMLGPHDHDAAVVQAFLSDLEDS